MSNKQKQQPSPEMVEGPFYANGGPYRSDIREGQPGQKLDLTITVDTSLLHLGGALGVPVWGLLSRRCDWRWFDLEKESTPWYKSVRLFRQRRFDDWEEVFQRVARELSDLVARFTLIDHKESTGPPAATRMTKTF